MREALSVIRLRRSVIGRNLPKYRRHTPTAIAVLLIVFWVVTKIPPPAWYILDLDQGDLAISVEIEHGRHPFTDVRPTVYGPAMHYASYLAQVLSGFRPIGKAVLIAIALVIAYCAQFWALRRLGVGRWVALAFIAVSLAVMPRLFSYFFALLPPLYAIALLAHMRSPSSWRAALLGATIGMCGLFRLDLGGYAVISSLTALLLQGLFDRRRLEGRQVLAAIGGGFIVVGPWLVFLVAQGALLTVPVELWRTMRQMTPGMSVPLPAFEWDWPLQPTSAIFMLFWGALGIQVAAVIMAISRHRRLEAGELAFVGGLVVFAILVINQAAYRSDPDHVMQAQPAQILLAAWLYVHARIVWERGHRVVGSVVVIALLVLGFAALRAHKLTVRPTSTVQRWVRLPRDLATLSLPVQQFRQQVQGVPWHLSWYLDLADWVETATDPDDNVLFLPYYQQLYYLTQRPYGTPFGIVFPGALPTEAAQRNFLTALRTSGTRLIADDPAFSFDGQPERNARHYANVLISGVYERFAIVNAIGPMVVLRPSHDTATPAFPGLRRLRIAPTVPTGVERGDRDTSRTPTPDIKLLAVNTLPTDGVACRWVPRGGILLALFASEVAREKERLWLALEGEKNRYAASIDPVAPPDRIFAPRYMWDAATHQLAADTSALAPARYELMVGISGNHSRPSDWRHVGYSVQIYEPDTEAPAPGQSCLDRP